MRVWARRAVASTLIALLAVAGCGADTAGTATVHPDATVATGPAVSADTAPAPPVRSAPSTVAPPAVTTLTVTTTEVPPTGASSTNPPPATPSVPPTDLSGEVYGFVTAVDVAGSTLTLDKIDWFTGAAAQQACAADGVTDTSDNRCTGWYYRNRNPALRQVAVAPDASIIVLDGGVRGVPGDLAAVGAATAHFPWRMTVVDGRVTRLEEIYLP